MTRQREVILRIIQSSDQHLTAEQIYQASKRELPSLAVGTVYNNLNALCAEGTITRVRINRQPDRFDRAPAEQLHHHMVCDRCGRIADLMLNDLNRYLNERCEPQISSVELTAHYICEECLNRYETRPSGRKPFEDKSIRE